MSFRTVRSWPAAIANEEEWYALFTWVHPFMFKVFVEPRTINTYILHLYIPLHEQHGFSVGVISPLCFAEGTV